MSSSSGLRADIIVTIQAFLLPVTCIITYFIARAQDHVEERFPYISDSGTYSPESCIFGLLLAFYAMATFLCVYVRWSVVRDYSAGASRTPRMNNIALILGLIASLGILLVATFQETSVLIVHLIGALLAFGVGCVYMWLQAFISIRARTIPGYVKCLCYFRVCIALLSSVLVILAGGLGMAAQEKMPANKTRTEVPGSGKWDPTMEGFDIHLTSTSSEWAFAGLVGVYFLTFVSEFRYIRVSMPVVHLRAIQQAGLHPDTDPSDGIIGPGYEDTEKS